MNDNEKQEAFAAFLMARKHPIEPMPDFSKRVMASVSEWERSRNINPEKHRSQSPRWQETLQKFLLGSPRGRLAMALALILISFLPVSVLYLRDPAPKGISPQSNSTRIKGGVFRLEFLLKRGSHIEPAVAGSLFFPGDRLQAIYSSPVNGYLQLFSMNSQGEITCISCQAASEKLGAGQAKSLPYALELDSSRTDEAMIAILSEKPLSREVSTQALKLSWEKNQNDLTKIGTYLKNLLPAHTETSVFPIRKTFNQKNIKGRTL